MCATMANTNQFGGTQHFKQCIVIVNELAQIEFISADDLEDIPQQD